MSDSSSTVTVLIGDSQQAVVELITDLIREVLGKSCDLRIHYSNRADDLVSLAETHQIDLFVLFLNNILFTSGNLPSKDRMSMVMRLVWNIKSDYDKPVIGICGLAEYEDYSKIAGVDAFFKAPFNNDLFMKAVRKCLSYFTGK